MKPEHTDVLRGLPPVYFDKYLDNSPDYPQFASKPCEVIFEDGSKTKATYVIDVCLQAECYWRDTKTMAVLYDVTHWKEI